MAFDPDALSNKVFWWKLDAADASRGNARNHFSANGADPNIFVAPEQFYRAGYYSGAQPFWGNILGASVTEGISDPFGGNRACRFARGASAYIQGSHGPVVPTTGNWTYGCWARSNTGSSIAAMYISLGGVGGDSNPNYTLTTSWARYQHTTNVTSLPAGLKPTVYSDNAGDIDVFGWMIVPGTGPLPDYVHPDFELRLIGGADAPTWNSRGLVLSGSSRVSGLAVGQSYPAVEDFTCFYVMKTEGSAYANQGIAIRDVANTTTFQPFSMGAFNSAGVNRQGVNAAGAILRTIGPTLDEFGHVYCVRRSGENLTYFLNGTKIKTVTGASTDWTSEGFLLGDPNYGMVGELYEAMLVATALTDEQCVEGSAYFNGTTTAKGCTIHDNQRFIRIEGDSLSELFGDWAAYSYTFRLLQHFEYQGVTNAISNSSFIAGPENITDRLPLFEQLMYPLRGRTYTLVWIGTNDLANGRTSAQVYADIKTYCQALRAQGLQRIGVATILPRNIGGTFETRRLEVNASINANAVSEGWADYVVGTGESATIGNPANFATLFLDGVHLNEDGHDDALALFIDCIEYFDGLPAQVDENENAFPQLIGAGFGKQLIRGGPL